MPCTLFFSAPYAILYFLGNKSQYFLRGGPLKQLRTNFYVVGETKREADVRSTEWCLFFISTFGEKTQFLDWKKSVAD